MSLWSAVVVSPLVAESYDWLFRKPIPNDRGGAIGEDHPASAYLGKGCPFAKLPGDRGELRRQCQKTSD